LGVVIIVLGPDVQVAIWAPEALDKPVFEAVLVEGVTTTGHDFYFFALGEVAEADGAAFVFENQGSLASPVFLLSDRRTDQVFAILTRPVAIPGFRSFRSFV